MKLLTTLLAGLTGLAGCTGTVDPAPEAASPSHDPHLVSQVGLAEIRFGDTREVLERDHGLIQEPGDCAPRLPDQPAVSPVFEGDRLVLLWVDPPLHTPAGLAVGSPVAAVRAAHPDAEDLPAPADPFQFHGLIVTVDDRAYLFLHDQELVQKLIIGFDRHARLVHHEQFGVC
ncbi:MAG: hypothetical protein GEV12_10235 [Micromonosporaceae bacterium]|nr:hypothetical protein [Micromonosporaceae bacterium]